MEDNTKQQDSSAKTPNKNKVRAKRVVVALVVIVAVFVVSGIGFSQWHNMPGFCNALCHDPMDAYVTSYTDGEYDAYGNKMEDEAQSVAMTAYLHNVDYRITCPECHEATLDETVSQGIAWATGDYTIAGTNEQGQCFMYELSSEELLSGDATSSDSASGAADDTSASGDSASDSTDTASSNDSTAGDQFCLKAGCHTDLDHNDILDRSQLTEMTEYLGEYNPHRFVVDENHSTTQCTDCHKAHTRSVNTCTECHEDATVPNGWLNYDERQQIEKEAFGNN